MHDATGNQQLPLHWNLLYGSPIGTHWQPLQQPRPRFTLPQRLKRGMHCWALSTNTCFRSVFREVCAKSSLLPFEWSVVCFPVSARDRGAIVEIITSIINAHCITKEAFFMLTIFLTIFTGSITTQNKSFYSQLYIGHVLKMY